MKLELFVSVKQIIAAGGGGNISEASTPTPLPGEIFVVTSFACCWVVSKVAKIVMKCSDL